MKTHRKISIATPYIDYQEIDAVKKPLKSGWLTQGKNVAAFEKKFALMHGLDYAIAASSCTAALHMALIALGIGPGDEVIAPSFTWIATANAVEYTGARPVFCDIERGTFNIAVDKVESLISPKTRAIIPVHLFGLCADMDKLIPICKKYGISIIEDAACAIGASINNKKAGSFGDIGCFSFHPRKIVTTGEGGMCTTNDKGLAQQLASLRDHGASISVEKQCAKDEPYTIPDFNILGYNYRMTDLQAAIGLVQLSRLKYFISQRHKWAKWYCRELADLKWLITPNAPDGFKHSYQSFVCYIDEKQSPLPRNSIMEKLHSKGISTRPGTIAVHMQNYYIKKYHIDPGSLPVSRDCQMHSMAIPLHNRMSEDDYRYVVRALKGIK